jgi:hypothetical protein
MFDDLFESRGDRLAREAKEVKLAKEVADQQLKISEALFIFGDIRLDILKGFRSASIAYIYDEDEEDNYYGTIDPSSEPVYDDMQGSSFKVGDRFTCRVRESKKETNKEIWLQYRFNKNYVNLYDPGRYFFEKVDSISMFIFVKPDGLSMIMTSEEPLEFSKARALMVKTSKSIIKYDDNGYTVIKQRKAKAQVSA